MCFQRFAGGTDRQKQTQTDTHKDIVTYKLYLIIRLNFKGKHFWFPDSCKVSFSELFGSQDVRENHIGKFLKNTLTIG